MDERPELTLVVVETHEEAPQWDDVIRTQVIESDNARDDSLGTRVGDGSLPN